MATQKLPLSDLPVMSDPEWIALESIDEQTRHFIFDDTVLHDLRQRGLVEPQGDRWRLTCHGHLTLGRREAVSLRA